MHSAHENKFTFPEPRHQLIEAWAMSLIMYQYGTDLWNSLNVSVININFFNYFKV